jgi:hypothetical protein
VDLEKRSALLDWVYEIKRRFKFTPHTFEMSINIIDRFLVSKGEEPINLCLLGLCSLYIANIYNEKDSKSIDEFVVHSKGKKIKDIINFCVKIISTINYQFKTPSYQDFFAIHHGYTNEYEFQLAHFIIYTSLYNPQIVRHPPSYLVSASCWLAHIILTKKDDDDLDYYIHWYRASFGVIPDSRVIVDLFNSFNDGEHLLSISNDFVKIKKKLSERKKSVDQGEMTEECIINQMENMLRNVAFDEDGILEKRRKLYLDEINDEIEFYKSQVYPKTINAHKKYLKKY